MVKILSSRSATLGNTQKTNTAFKTIFKGATNSKRQGRILFSAFKQLGKGKVLTKKITREIFRKAEELGMSHKDTLAISRKVLKGESSSSRIRYSNNSSISEGSHSNAAQQESISEKPQVDMNKIMQEIMDKRKKQPLAVEQNIPKNNKSETRSFNFKVSEKNLRNAERLFQSSGNEQMIQKADATKHTADRQEESEIDEIRNRLARIQQNTAEETDNPPDFHEKNNIKSHSDETFKKENDKSTARVYIPVLNKKDEGMEEVKKRLAEIQKKPGEEITSNKDRKQYSDYSFQELTKGIIAESGFDLHNANEKGSLLFQDLMNKSEKEITDYIYNSAQELSDKSLGIENVKKEKIEILSSFGEKLEVRNRDRSLSDKTQAKIKEFMTEIERILKIIEKCEARDDHNKG